MFGVIWVLLCVMGVILRVRNCVVLCYGLMLCLMRVIIHVSREL
jgi:hypothetical protein